MTEGQGWEHEIEAIVPAPKPGVYFSCRACGNNWYSSHATVLVKTFYRMYKNCPACSSPDVEMTFVTFFVK